MKILDKIFGRNKYKNAAEQGSNRLFGVPIVSMPRTYRYVNRNISAQVIADLAKVPKVLSAMVTLSRLCFPGFDLHVYPLDDGDDTQTEKIEVAKAKISKIDASLGRIGKRANSCTLDMIRATMRDTLCYRQSIFEVVWKIDDGWLVPRVQHLPPLSFSRMPTKIAGQERYIADKLLPGVVFDTSEARTEFWQTQTPSAQPIQLDSDTILYIEDIAVPDDTSFLGSLAPSIIQWQEMRKNLMLAVHRIGAPNEVAQIEMPAKDAPLAININDLVNYAKDLIMSQGSETAKVSMPGMHLEYPNISMPLNPLDPDQYLKKEIIEHFFARDILEVTSQAISATNAPVKALLDQLVSGYREVNGAPWEAFWNKFLEENGFDLRCQFQYWDITPKDIAAERAHMIMSLNAGTMLVNEYRRMNGWPEYDDAQMEQLKAERQAIKPVGKGSQGGQIR